MGKGNVWGGVRIVIEIQWPEEAPVDKLVIEQSPKGAEGVSLARGREGRVDQAV